MLKSILKKILWIIVVFVAIDAAAIVVIPKLVSVDKIKPVIQEKVREATGRDLDFAEAQFVFWPNVGVELKRVSFGNASWAQNRQMVTLGKANVALEVMPLLEHHIVVKRFTLDAPVIRLETAEDGRHNWDFQAAAAPAAPERKQSLEAPAGGKIQGFDIQFGGIEIDHGKLSISDRQKKSETTLDDVNVRLTLPTLASAARLSGDVTYLSKKIMLAMDLEKPLDLAAGKSSNGKLSVKSDAFTAEAAGTFASHAPFLTGRLEAEVFSLPKTVAWVQKGPAPKLPFEKMSFSSNARLTDAEASLKDADLKLDDVNATGDATLGFGGKPQIYARLSVNKLNLDRFTGGAEAANNGDGAAPAPATAGTDWDATPIDFSPLRAVNADVKVQTQGFTLKGVEVGASTLTALLQNGALRFSSTQAALFDGTFSSDLSVNAAQSTPAISFSFNMNGVQALPVLTTFAHFKKLSGAASAHVSVSALGNSQKALISSLSGKGDADFKNGALQGIDFLQIARLLQARTANMSVGDGKTEFVDLSGTFTIANGVATNDDLKMKGTLVSATGKGTLDLPRKYVQYRVIPELVNGATVKDAQGVETAQKGVTVPVNIAGPFSDIRVKPDYASAVQNILNDPSAAKATARNVRDNIRDIRQNLKKDPAAAIQDILGGGGLGGLLGKKQPPAEEAPPINPSQPQSAAPDGNAPGNTTITPPPSSP